MATKEKCKICRGQLDTDGLYEDCGGDCLVCMAKAGDPDAVLKVIKLAQRMASIISSARLILNTSPDMEIRNTLLTVLRID